MRDTLFSCGTARPARKETGRGRNGALPTKNAMVEDEGCGRVRVRSIQVGPHRASGWSSSRCFSWVTWPMTSRDENPQGLSAFLAVSRHASISCALKQPREQHCGRNVFRRRSSMCAIRGVHLPFASVRKPVGIRGMCLPRLCGGC